MFTSFEDRSEVKATVFLTIAGFVLTLLMLVGFTQSHNTRWDTEDQPDPKRSHVSQPD